MPQTASRKGSAPRKSTPAPAARAEGPYFSRAVGKALELLDILGKSGQPLALNALAARVKLTKTSALRLLCTLEATGYVEKHPDGRYAAQHQLRTNLRDKAMAALREAATPHMQALTREFGETTSLAALFSNHIEVLKVVESLHTVRMGNTVGRIIQPHASSLGKCITAFQSEARREHLVRSYGMSAATEHTITDENRLVAELRGIRERGYATDREETCLGGYCFGAPIRNAEGEVFAAISMSLPKVRLGGPEAQQLIVGRLQQAAAAIGKGLK